MNKLKYKVFWTIFTLLTLCLLIILFIFSFQEYSRSKNDIERNLMRLNNKPKGNINNPINNIQEPKRFMDATLYTVVLDNDKIVTTISHTEDGVVNNKIKNIAQKIINQNSESVTHVSNLYFEKYAYVYSKGNYITLMDITEIRNRLLSSMQISVLIFILLEVLILLIANLLAKWITIPALESFEKQKQFIADASHELKTPLSVIIASSESLGHTKNKKKLIDNIQSEAERMSKLVKQLLDLARLDNDNIKKQHQLCDLSKIIEKEILILESLAYEKNITLKYNISKDIKFNCNSEEMKQLILILMDNAIKHSLDNGNINVELYKNFDTITLKVQNEGNPIPKEEEEKIFERFYKLDKARNRNDDSYGLGLAIAKSIVTKHGGIIKASSNDKTTTFTINFKIKRTLNN